MAEHFTTKQLLFIEEYIGGAHFNATEAARRAGYQGSDATLASVGHENLRKPKIAARIRERIAQSAMTADEVLYRLGEQARASLADFLIINEETGGWYIDLAKAQREGQLHLVKRIWIDRSGNRRLELHDQQAALVHLGKHLGLFTEQMAVNLRGAIVQDGVNEWAHVPDDELDQAIANLQAATGRRPDRETPAPDTEPAGPAPVDDPAPAGPNPG